MIYETLKDAFDDYLEYLKNIGWHGRPSALNTIKRHQSELDHIASHPIASKPPLDITFKEIINARNDWKEEKNSRGRYFTPSGLNTRVKVFNLLLRLVYLYEEEKRTPPQMPRYSAVKTEKRGKVLNKDQIASLLYVFKTEEKFKRYYPMILIGFLTGARFCEISALHWDDMDFEKGRFRFNRTSCDGDVSPGRKNSLLSTWYPIIPQLKEALVQHKENLLLHPRIPDDTHLIFPAVGDPNKLKRGGYMQRYNLRRVLEIACEKAGIPVISPHDMRRSLNTFLRKEDIDPEKVRAMLGHHTEEMTCHYTYFDASDKTELIDHIYDEFNQKEGKKEEQR